MNATAKLACNDRSVVDHVALGLTAGTPVAVVMAPVYRDCLVADPCVHTLMRKRGGTLSVGSPIRDAGFSKRGRT
jgi:hypothetical protein